MFSELPRSNPNGELSIRSHALELGLSLTFKSEYDEFQNSNITKPHFIGRNLYGMRSLSGCPAQRSIYWKTTFGDPGGYYTAMNGLYNNLTSNSLYGKNLSYELIDVISKRYAPLAKSTYLTSLNSWGYAEENVSKALESTWATAYTTILNCNVILENLATQQGILSPAKPMWWRENYWPSGLSSFRHVTLIRPHL